MGRRHLKTDQKLLVDQKLVGAKKLNKDEIKSLYSNRPNEKILFLTWSPYVDLYQLGLKTYDTTKYENRKKKSALKYEGKISKAQKRDKTKKTKRLKEKLGKKLDKQNINIKEGNLGMRLGEPLAIFDTTKENETVRRLDQYLHSKGYFNSKVSYEIEETFKLVTSTYIIEKNLPFTVDSIRYELLDSVQRSILIQNSQFSFIKKGENYQQQNLKKERDRINTLMLDNGYYNFIRRNIKFKVDSTSLPQRKLIVVVEVQNPVDLKSDKIFELDSVIFTTDVDAFSTRTKRSYNIFKGVTYEFHSRRYHEKILDWRMFIYPDSSYSRKNTLETQKQLSYMDIFKFINISYDTTDGQFIAHLKTSRLKKFQTSTEAGLSVTEGLPGPFFNASIKNRNTFKGLEITELSGRIGFEGLTGATETSSPYASLDYGGNLSLTFPQFILPIGNKYKSKLGRFNPKTRFAVGLNYNARPEYLRNSVSAKWSYTWQNFDKNKSHTLDLSEVNLISSDVTPGYQTFLDSLALEGNNLGRSFDPSFVSSTAYTVIYNINEYGNNKTTSSYLRYRIESGGNVFQSLGQWSEDNNIEFFKFAKFNIDYRKVHPILSDVSLAYRVNLGVAIPYGKNETLPYEKFYFAGGSNSIRAWDPRRLGPGSFLPTDENGEYSKDIERPGEILLEASVELRHKLFGPVHGAIFADAGNVWTLREDSSTPGSQFEFNDFIQEIALGAGYGLRIDFSFLILRLDAAWKLIEPGKTTSTETFERNTFELPDFSNYQRLVWNLGIGHPF